MRKFAALWVVVMVIPGCGGTKNADAPPPATTSDERVIRDWVDSLRKADFDHAKELFATPSVIENGSGKIVLKTPAAVDAFNRSLPCGAVLKHTQEQAGGHTLGIFRLTMANLGRDCRGSVGAEARVSFLIDEDGHIKEWFRVSTQPPPGSQQS